MITKWPSNSTPWYLLKREWKHTTRKTCTRMLTAALFTIAPLVKQFVTGRMERHPHDGRLQHGWLSNTVLRGSFALQRIHCLRPWIRGSRWGYLMVKNSEQILLWSGGRDLTGKGHEGTSWCGGQVLYLDKSIRKEGSVRRSVVSDPLQPHAL